MCEIKKILGKVFLLTIDIFLFGYDTIRQIILPGKRKKGNLLSTLFIFFVGVIERLGSFEYGVFRSGNLLKQKYIKRSLFIIAGLLFLLSSFEWTSEKNVSNYIANYVAQLSDTEIPNTALTGQLEKSYSKTASLFKKCLVPYCKNNLHYSSSTVSSPVKTFLLIRSLRI